MPECSRAKISNVCNFCGLRHITLVLSVKFYKVSPVLCKIRSVLCKIRPFPGQRNVTLVLKAKNNVKLNLLLEITVSGVLNKYANPNFAWPIR